MTSMVRKAWVVRLSVAGGAEATSTATNPDVSNRLIDPDATAERNLIDSLPVYIM
jgi:hypothetical protein